jgi:hypothetical protein
MEVLNTAMDCICGERGRLFMKRQKAIVKEEVF